MPPEKSTNAAPALVGGPSDSPVAEALPDIACTVMSIADMWAYGTGGAVALAAGHDQPRVVLEESLRAQLKALHGARREVLDQHVGGLDQVEQRLATGVGLQVQHHAALVGIEHHEFVGLGRLV